MPTITLTEFFDFISATGMKRLEKVRKLKNRDGYAPQEDYYKRFREGVQSLHRTREDKAQFFRQLVAGVHPNKRLNYKRMADGYKRFLGQNEVAWSRSHKRTWEHRELTVKLVPVWFLTIGGSKHIIKPHLSKTSLSRAKDKVALILFLMRHCAPPPGASTVVGMLDVGNSKLYRDGPTDPNVELVLRTEADSFLGLYNAVV